MALNPARRISSPRKEYGPSRNATRHSTPTDPSEIARRHAHLSIQSKDYLVGQANKIPPNGDNAIALGLVEDMNRQATAQSPTGTVRDEVVNQATGGMGSLPMPIPDNIPPEMAAGIFCRDHLDSSSAFRNRWEEHFLKVSHISG